MTGRRARSLLAGLSALAALAPARSVLAGPPDCGSLPNRVYLQVGDTQEPLMKALGQKLRASAVQPITIIYKLNGSCTNIDAMYNGTKLTTNPNYIPSQAEMPGWDPTQPAPQCTIDPNGVSLDLGNSNVFVSACTQTATPAGIGLFQGAIQPYVFIVPKSSTQVAITAEQAYFVFGFGASDQVTPWNDPAFMFTRPATKSTLVSMAANIHVPPNKWQGTPLSASSDVLNAVATSLTSPQKTIGIMGAEVYDQNRSLVSSLAFRAFQQRHAYYPDSTAASRDKQNLRDGHYLIWSPTVYFGPTDSTGMLTNTLAKYVVDLITDRAAMPAPDFDPLATVISVGLVPDCAMKVNRTAEGGDVALYTPATPCGCFFESQVGTTPASCTACTSDATCNGGKCRHGFCEAK